MSRYSRQEVLEIIGKKGQKTLKNSSVVIVGVGALGTVAAELLARAGIGIIKLIDSDIIEISNLQRQSLYTQRDVARYKAKTAEKYINKINSDIKIESINIRLTSKNIDLLKSDLVLDCTDNMNTRFLINEFCHKEKIPFIHAAAIQDKGTVFNIIPKKPCLSCIYNKTTKEETCEELGVLNTTSHIVASIQVTECLKILLNKSPETKLLRINALNHSIDKIKVKKNKKCLVCNGKYSILKSDSEDFTIKKCKTKAAYSVKRNSQAKLNLNKIKETFQIILDTPILLVVKRKDAGEIVIHQHGEIQFKTLEDKELIKEIARNIYEVAK